MTSSMFRLPALLCLMQFLICQFSLSDPENSACFKTPSELMLIYLPCQKWCKIAKLALWKVMPSKVASWQEVCQVRKQWTQIHWQCLNLHFAIWHITVFSVMNAALCTTTRVPVQRELRPHCWRPRRLFPLIPRCSFVAIQRNIRIHTCDTRKC